MNFPSMLYVGANSVGWFLYIFFVEAVTRRVRMEQRAPEFGDGVHLLYTAVPVALVFLIVNIVWGVLAWKRSSLCGGRGAIVAWMGVVTTWAVVYLVVRYLP